MKSKAGFIVYMLVCAAIIASAIIVGSKQHGDCRECKLAVSGQYEMNKFAACNFEK
jgi:hypothetical protein